MAALAVMTELDEALRPEGAPTKLEAAVAAIPDGDAHPELYSAVATAHRVLS